MRDVLSIVASFGVLLASTASMLLLLGVALKFVL